MVLHFYNQIRCETTSSRPKSREYDVDKAPPGLRHKYLNCSVVVGVIATESSSH